MIVAVVVTFEPGSVDVLLQTLESQCDRVIVVDNGSTPGPHQQLTASCKSAGAELISESKNLGIAGAQNIGIARALAAGADAVLLSDQDSIPTPGMVDSLWRALVEDPTIAAVGPLPTENREGGDELVYVDRGWSPKRATREELSQPRLEVAFLLASGCLIRRQALEHVGPMREDLFIDHVDLEWGVRARNAGWRLVAVPEVTLHHSLGDSVVRLPGRDQPIHVHAPVRNYYIVRNTIALIAWPGMPRRWRIRYAYWVTRYAVFNALCVGRRSERSRLIARGIRDGLLGRLGPMPEA